MMGRFKVNLQIILIVCALVSIGVFAFQMRKSNTLKSELSRKKELLEQLVAAKQRIEDIKKELEVSKSREKELYKKIPVGEETILELIKDLTKLASRQGLKNVQFTIQGAAKAAKEEPKKIKRKAVPGKIKTRMPLPTAETKSDKGTLATPYYFDITFKAGFKELLSFLEQAMTMTRIVSVERVEIQRTAAALPYQVITLKLATYTF